MAKATVYQTNKKTGVTYVYESVSFWDKEKKQSRSHRKLIGKLEGDRIVSTKKRKENTKDITQSSRYFYGAVHLFDKIAYDTGLLQDLKVCFGEGYKQILSIAYYLILEDKNPLKQVFASGL
jgi:hypothetical protein